MSRQTEEKIILIVRKTRLDEALARFNTVSQAKFYIESLGADFSDYQEEDKAYKRVLSNIEQDLQNLGRVQILERSYVPNFIFGKNDIVLAVGQDGLVANTLKYLDTQPLIGINPDPKRWDGILLPFKAKDAGNIVRDLLLGKKTIKEVTFAKLVTNDKQSMYAVNDFYIGPRTHTSARYLIEVNKKQEQQSSSGILVSTGLGSTGWMKSVIAGAKGILTELEGKTKSCKNYEGFSWDADYLYYSVREPFPSKNTGVELVFGLIPKKESMIITSLMAQNGIIFSDGIESDFIEFNAGTQATITVADKKGYLVI